MVINLRDLTTGKERTITNGDGRVLSVAFDDTSAKLISASDDGAVTLRAAETGEPIGAPTRDHVGRTYAVPL